MPHLRPPFWLLPEPPAPEAASAERVLVWLRRDLRLDDHTALSLALRSARQVWCVFIFDTNILAPLARDNRRVDFLHASLSQLDGELRALGGGLIVRHGPAVPQLCAVAQALQVQQVYCSRDYEPAALQRDQAAQVALSALGIKLYGCKDQVIFEADELLTAAGRPYTVYTPYKNAWLKRLGDQDQPPRPVLPHRQAMAAVPPPLDTGLPSLAELGFATTGVNRWLPPGVQGANQRLQDFIARMDHYAERRDFPAAKGPSYLSVDLRFGSVSVRQLVRLAHARSLNGSLGAQVWLSELIWREFYMQVLFHHPHVVGQCFRPEYDAVAWEQGPQAEAHFQAWCEGRTGYPLVDAAMRQLRQTGYMHNRLRMVAASFLCKDLGLDWRWGEAWFAQQLNDFDLAANNGGWQWSASTGCDAQPYFRIFNPVSQSQKFDPQGRFIRRYVPELNALPDAALHAPWLAKPVDLAAADWRLGLHYPAPIVDHATARGVALARYGKVKGPPQD